MGFSCERFAKVCLSSFVPK